VGCTHVVPWASQAVGLGWDAMRTQRSRRWVESTRQRTEQRRVLIGHHGLVGAGDEHLVVTRVDDVEIVALLALLDHLLMPRTFEGQGGVYTEGLSLTLGFDCWLKLKSATPGRRYEREAKQG
jgi:hypothetical protein